MTRTEFNRRFAATAENMNYATDGDFVWAESEIAEINDTVFDAVSDIDAGGDWAEQLVNGAFNRAINNYAA